MLTPIFCLCLLSAGWALAVYDHGGVEPVTARYSVIAISLAALLGWLFSGGRRSPKLPRLDVILLCAALLLTALQLAPLPFTLIRLVSPNRAQQLSTAAPALGTFRSASLSSVPAAGPDALLILAAYVLVFLLVRDLRRRFQEKSWLLVLPILILASLEATLGILQFYTGAESSVGSYMNRNHFAALLEWSLPFAIMYGISVINRHRHAFQAAATPGILVCFSFGIAALMLVSVVDSHSRMGFAASLIAMFVIGALLLWHRESGGRRGRRFWVALLGLGAAVLGAIVFFASDQLIGRMAEMTNVQDLNTDTRKQLWKETLPLIADYAVTGCGIGAYESCFLPYKTVAPERTADYAHNDFLQAMAELGLPAFGCLLAVVAMAYWTALKKTGHGHSGRYLAIACVGSLTAILLHSLVDFNMYIPANGMLAAWVAGMAREA